MQRTLVQTICPDLPHYTTVGERYFAAADGLTLADVADDTAGDGIYVDPESFICSSGSPSKTSGTCPCLRKNTCNADFVGSA